MAAAKTVAVDKAAQRAAACKQAHADAQSSAQAAADALGIDYKDSPLLEELKQRAIPKGKDAQLAKHFIEQMKQIEEAATALKAAAS